jgi:hypothetical protein
MVAKIVRVCAMLHNICVDRWIINNPSRFGRGLQHWPEAPSQWGTDDLSPADDEIIERLHNNYVTARARSADSFARDQLMEEIYELGLGAVRDTEFNPVN